LVKCRKVGAANWGNSKKEGLGEVSDAQKRKIYKKAFGKEYDDPKRRQSPLPLDIAYKVALNRLKKKEGVNEAQRTSVSKSELSKAIKQIRGKEKGFHKPIGATLIMKLAQELNIMPSIIYKLMIKYKVGTKHIKGVRFEGLGDKISKKLKKHKGTKVKKVKLRSKSGMGTISHFGMKEDVFIETITNGRLKTSHVYYESEGKPHGYTFEFVNDLNEAEYQGRKIKLNKIMQGDVKKFKVYVKNPKGNVVKVNFGHGGPGGGKGMRIRKSNPGARKSFRARHNCDNPGPKHKARYWACRTW